MRAAADAIRRGGASTVIAARRMAPTPRATGGRDPPRAGDAARGPCFASRRVWGPQTGKHAENRALRPHRGVLRTGQTPKTQGAAAWGQRPSAGRPPHRPRHPPWTGSPNCREKSGTIRDFMEWLRKNGYRLGGLQYHVSACRQHNHGEEQDPCICTVPVPGLPRRLAPPDPAEGPQRTRRYPPRAVPRHRPGRRRTRTPDPH